MGEMVDFHLFMENQCVCIKISITVDVYILNFPVCAFKADEPSYFKNEIIGFSFTSVIVRSIFLYQ